MPTEKNYKTLENYENFTQQTGLVIDRFEDRGMGLVVVFKDPFNAQKEIVMSEDNLRSRIDNLCKWGIDVSAETAALCELVRRKGLDVFAKSKEKIYTSDKDLIISKLLEELKKAKDRLDKIAYLLNGGTTPDRIREAYMEAYSGDVQKAIDEYIKK
jgi:hypothetical protein